MYIVVVPLHGVTSDDMMNDLLCTGVVICADLIFQDHLRVVLVTAQYVADHPLVVIIRGVASGVAAQLVIDHPLAAVTCGVAAQLVTDHLLVVITRGVAAQMFHLLFLRLFLFPHDDEVAVD